MFIYSMRASTLKFFGVITLSLVALFVLISLVPTYDEMASAPSSAISQSGETINFKGIRSNEDRIAFFRQFGWEVKPEPLEEAEIVIPAEFDKVMTLYNEMQKQQGLDLDRYRRKSATRYTYEITNYPDYDGTVYANIILYRGRVIAGDVCTADVSGFAHGLSRTNP